MPCGPPWIESIIGYFRVGSKSGGLMIQPWTLKPSTDVYQISSVAPSRLPASRSALMSVTWRGVWGCARSNTTMLPGSVAVVRVAAATPVLLMLATVR